MSKLQGYALTLDTSQEIVAAYASASYTPTPTATNAPCVVIGAFKVPAAVTARLSVLGVRHGTAQLTVEVFDPQQVAIVDLTSAEESEHRSEPISFVSGKTYQIGVRFLGTNSSGAVRSVSLVGV
jgi:NADPH-dependent glutamate synthase beta subunit-like oxidoreductase